MTRKKLFPSRIIIKRIFGSKKIFIGKIIKNKGLTNFKKMGILTGAKRNFKKGKFCIEGKTNRRIYIVRMECKPLERERK